MGFCPNCGNATDGTRCEKCGYGMYTANQESGMDFKKVVAILCFVVAAVILLFSFISFTSISKAANNLQDLRSVSGNTVAEAYYNECGNMYSGLATFVLVFGIFAGSLLSYIGVKNIKR